MDGFCNTFIEGKWRRPIQGVANTVDVNLERVGQSSNLSAESRRRGGQAQHTLWKRKQTRRAAKGRGHATQNLGGGDVMTV